MNATERWADRGRLAVRMHAGAGAFVAGTILLVCSLSFLAPEPGILPPRQTGELTGVLFMILQILAVVPWFILSVVTWYVTALSRVRGRRSILVYALLPGVLWPALLLYSLLWMRSEFLFYPVYALVPLLGAFATPCVAALWLAAALMLLDPGPYLDPRTRELELYLRGVD